MKKHKPLFSKFKNDYAKYPLTVDSHDIVIWDGISLANCRKKDELTKQLIESISSINENEIVQLALGFDFANGVNSVRLKNKSRMRMEDNIDMVERYALSYERAVNTLSEHITFLKMYFLS